MLFDVDISISNSFLFKLFIGMPMCYGVLRGVIVHGRTEVCNGSPHTPKDISSSTGYIVLPSSGISTGIAAPS